MTIFAQMSEPTAVLLFLAATRYHTQLAHCNAPYEVRDTAYGLVIGGAVGGLAGGAVGYYVGSKAATTVYNSVKSGWNSVTNWFMRK